MKPGVKSKADEKRFFLQLFISVLLLVFPVCMILFNGKRALQGIFWHVPKEIRNTVDHSQLTGTSNASLRINPPEFGIYDPENKFSGNNEFKLEQIYLSWIDIRSESFQQRLDQIVSGGRSPVITIEPWNSPGAEQSLLADISLGKYDSHIDTIIKILSGLTDKHYIIWGHEMDQDLTKRYPWSGKDPEEYIAAYRYVHNRMSTHLSHAEWIWSPVVKKGCERYWPGEEYVDLIGMPIYSYPAWEKSYYGYIRSFESWYTEKYNLVKQFNKPVIIVEMGVTGSADYQTYWLQEAFEYFQDMKSIEKVIFFHARDTE